MADLTPEATPREEAVKVARFWLRTLENCDCPPETYPTGHTLTLHDPFCSTNLRLVAGQLVVAVKAASGGEALDG